MENEKEKRTLKALSIVDDIINWVIRLAMIPILLCGIYIIADTMGVYSDASPNQVANYKPKVINEEALKEISGNCVAWIQIDGTTIDYPIMQGGDNMEYLNKNPYGEYALSGSIFLDYRNKNDFTDAYNLVYGHHMSGGLMFGALDDFTDEQYFNEHLTGTLTAGDKEYKLSVYAFFRCDAANEEVFNPYHEINNERGQFFTEHAWYTNGEVGERVIALTTCKSPGATDRTVLVVNIEETEDRQENVIASDEQ